VPFFHRDWNPEIERAFKEVLYRFMGEVEATKAVVYVRRPGGRWSLATQYGFGRRDALTEEFSDRHTLPSTVAGLGGEPRYFNKPSELGEVADYLARAGNSRLMLVPLVSATGLVGFVDVRDKGRKREFSDSDLELARPIAERLAGLVEELIIEPEPSPAETDRGEPAVAAGIDLAAGASDDSAALFDELGFEELRDAAAETLMDPRILAAALSITGRSAGATLVQQREGTPATDLRALISHQIDAMLRAAVPIPPEPAWKIELRRVSGQTAAIHLQYIASSVLLSDAGSSLVASVVVNAEPAVARETLERLNRRTLDVHDRYVLRVARRGLARRLLQPGERRYPELVAHSLGVSRLCWSLAGALDLGCAVAEEAALAGLLHDVGMRELDYDRLYLHPTPGPEDRRTYRLHVEVGERIVRVEGLSAIADAVRHHHERWDGNGYPDRLSEKAIPLLARIVHVAEVFDLFTAANSYRPAVSPDRALAILDRAAGHQFDPEVVEALARVVA
jgi:hypothetical protein